MSRSTATIWRSVIHCFFFQAEDGIRDYKVTGVQTCALPIFSIAEVRMAVATYGSENAGTLSSVRGTALQRPFQIVIMAADLLLILLSYGAGSALYSVAIASSGEGASIGAGLIVGVVFVGVAYFQDVYATHRLLNLVWQLRKAVFIWLASLTILAVAAFLLKSTDNLSRGTVIIFAAIGGVGLISLRFVWQFVLATN